MQIGDASSYGHHLNSLGHQCAYKILFCPELWFMPSYILTKDIPINLSCLVFGKCICELINMVNFVEMFPANSYVSI